MTPFFKYTLVALVINVVSMLLILFFIGDGSLDGLFLNILAIAGFILVEIIIAVSMLANEKMKMFGQAMLLSIGIILLIGFSWCGLLSLN